MKHSVAALISVSLGIALSACGAATTGTSDAQAPATTTDPPGAVAEPAPTQPADGTGDDRTDASTPAPTAPTGATVPPAPTTPAVEAPEAIRFSASLIGGGEIDLAGFAGRPVLLWFWSPF